MNVNELFDKHEDILSFPGSSTQGHFNNSNITMTGNGYLGYRGTFPDWKKEHYVACTVSDTYDIADGKWKELCNVPNGLFFRVEVSGSPDKSLGDDQTEMSHSLNFKYGISGGSLLSETVQSGKIEMKWSRFASYSDLHLLVQKITLKSENDCDIEIESGIDSNVWSLKGNHFSSMDLTRENGHLLCSASTKENTLPIFVCHHLDGIPGESTDSISENGAFGRYHYSLEAGREITCYVYMSVFSANDGVEPKHSCFSSIGDAIDKGYESLLLEHKAIWDDMWRSSTIKIEGDPLSYKLLHYNMYHNFISTPIHADHLPIGARGLSCQAYQGAAFWDQEIYNLPMFLYTFPEVARNLLVYRYKTLNGARKKAERLGYAGAYYAWISGDTGEELCPDYFFKDVLTHRKIRNHFNDWQIHISPDISYTIIKYYEVTGDVEFLVDFGVEMLLEIALFLYSRVHYSPYRDRYEILRVLGPDEYHENADNNAFTNTQAKFAIEKTISVVSMLKDIEPGKISEIQNRIGITNEFLEKLSLVAQKLYIPEPDENTGLIEQFDRYLELEDIKPADLSQRLIDDQEYWGWPNGIAYETQVIKQADVVQMFVLHEYPVEVMKTNYLYYEPRTQHRSSLSPGVHAIVAAQIGMKDQAYEYFLKSCSVDLANTHPPTSGGTFIGGIHTAACGISWQIAVRGFAGMKTEEKSISFNPNLPDKWEKLEFQIKYKGNVVNVSLTRNKLTFSLDSDLKHALTIHCFGQQKQLKEKGSLDFER